MILNKNITEIFPMSKEVDREYKPNNTNIPHMVSPIDGMKERKNPIPLKK